MTPVGAAQPPPAGPQGGSQTRNGRKHARNNGKKAYNRTDGGGLQQHDSHNPGDQTATARTTAKKPKSKNYQPNNVLLCSSSSSPGEDSCSLSPAQEVDAVVENCCVGGTSTTTHHHDHEHSCGPASAPEDEPPRVSGAAVVRLQAQKQKQDHNKSRIEGACKSTQDPDPRMKQRIGSSQSERESHAEFFRKSSAEFLGGGGRGVLMSRREDVAVDQFNDKPQPRALFSEEGEFGENEREHRRAGPGTERELSGGGRGRGGAATVATRTRGTAKQFATRSATPSIVEGPTGALRVNRGFLKRQTCPSRPVAANLNSSFDGAQARPRKHFGSDVENEELLRSVSARVDDFNEKDQGDPPSPGGCGYRIIEDVPTSEMTAHGGQTLGTTMVQPGHQEMNPTTHQFVQKATEGALPRGLQTPSRPAWSNAHIKSPSAVTPPPQSAPPPPGPTITSTNRSAQQPETRPQQIPNVLSDNNTAYLSDRESLISFPAIPIDNGSDFGAGCFGVSGGGGFNQNHHGYPYQNSGCGAITHTGSTSSTLQAFERSGGGPGSMISSSTAPMNLSSGLPGLLNDPFGVLGEITGGVGAGGQSGPASSLPNDGHEAAGAVGGVGGAAPGAYSTGCTMGQEQHSSTAQMNNAGVSNHHVGNPHNTQFLPFAASGGNSNFGSKRSSEVCGGAATVGGNSVCSIYTHSNNNTLTGTRDAQQLLQELSVLGGGTCTNAASAAPGVVGFNNMNLIATGGGGGGGNFTASNGARGIVASDGTTVFYNSNELSQQQLSCDPQANQMGTTQHIDQASNNLQQQQQQQQHSFLFPADHICQQQQQQHQHQQQEQSLFQQPSGDQFGNMLQQNFMGSFQTSTNSAGGEHQQFGDQQQQFHPCQQQQQQPFEGNLNQQGQLMTTHNDSSSCTSMYLNDQGQHHQGQVAHGENGTAFGQPMNGGMEQTTSSNDFGNFLKSIQAPTTPYRRTPPAQQMQMPTAAGAPFASLDHQHGSSQQRSSPVLAPCTSLPEGVAPVSSNTDHGRGASSLDAAAQQQPASGLQMQVQDTSPSLVQNILQIVQTPVAASSSQSKHLPSSLPGTSASELPGHHMSQREHLMTSSVTGSVFTQSARKMNDLSHLSGTTARGTFVGMSGGSSAGVGSGDEAGGLSRSGNACSRPNSGGRYSAPPVVCGGLPGSVAGSGVDVGDAATTEQSRSPGDLSVSLGDSPDQLTGLHRDLCLSSPQPQVPWQQSTAVGNLLGVVPQGGKNDGAICMPVAEQADPLGIGDNGMPLKSDGSKYHKFGVCKPCAFVHREGGCANGVNCQFCHECPAGEIKRRKKEKQKRKQFNRNPMLQSPQPGSLGGGTASSVVGTSTVVQHPQVRGGDPDHTPTEPVSAAVSNSRQQPSEHQHLPPGSRNKTQQQHQQTAQGRNQSSNYNRRTTTSTGHYFVGGSTTPLHPQLENGGNTSSYSTAAVSWGSSPAAVAHGHRGGGGAIMTGRQTVQPQVGSSNGNQKPYHLGAAGPRGGTTDSLAQIINADVDEGPLHKQSYHRGHGRFEPLKPSPAQRRGGAAFYGKSAGQSQSQRQSTSYHKDLYSLPIHPASQSPEQHPTNEQQHLHGHGTNSYSYNSAHTTHHGQGVSAGGYNTTGGAHGNFTGGGGNGQNYGRGQGQHQHHELKHQHQHQPQVGNQGSLSWDNKSCAHDDRGGHGQGAQYNWSSSSNPVPVPQAQSVAHHSTNAASYNQYPGSAGGGSGFAGSTSYHNQHNNASGSGGGGGGYVAYSNQWENNAQQHQQHGAIRGATLAGGQGRQIKRAGGGGGGLAQNSEKRFSGSTSQLGSSTSAGDHWGPTATTGGSGGRNYNHNYNSSSTMHSSHSQWKTGPENAPGNINTSWAAGANRANSSWTANNSGAASSNCRSQG